MPSATPPRPAGVERNLVVTVRDWSDPKHYLHDLTLTDQAQADRQRLRADLWGSGAVHRQPAGARPGQEHQDRHEGAGRRPEIHAELGARQSGLAPSPYFGTEQVWDTQVNAHNPMMDQDGRVYFTAQTRSPKDPPDYCKKESPLRSAQLYPLAGTARPGSCRMPGRSPCGTRTPRSSPSSTPASAPIT